MKANSIRALMKPREALRLLTECLVLNFTYIESRRRFCLVCDYPDEARGSDRAFAALVFEGVTDFVRESGDLAKFLRFKNAYSAADDETPIVVQGVRTPKHGTKSAIEFWFGPNFGGLQFAYDDISVFVRNAHARDVEGSFVYMDMTTGEKFEFSNPFAEIVGDDGTIG